VYSAFLCSQVNSSFLRGPYRAFIGREGMETITLGLVFRVQPEHFQSGTDDMKLKCLASISSVYWKTNEESIEGEKQSRPPVLEIKRTNDLDGDETSRADRVQGEFSAKIFNFISKSSSSTSCYVFRVNLTFTVLLYKNFFVLFACYSFQRLQTM
jgi:hypothetical protein